MNQTMKPWVARLAAPVLLTILSLQFGAARAQTAAATGVADSGATRRGSPTD
jgi:hypothetical protein